MAKDEAGTTIGAIPGNTLNHVGMVVADRDAAVARLGPLLGFSRIFPLDMDFSSVLVRGEERSFRLRAGYASLGPTILEFLEPLDDRSPHAVALAERGECFHHLCYGVADLAAEIDRYERAGMTRLIDATGPANPSPWIYLESSDAPGPVIELFQPNALSDELFEQIHSTLRGR